MDLNLAAIVLGIVEGITEFLPISSTGHLILVNKLVSFPEPFARLFDVVIQLGAILSVVVYFWRRLWPFDHRLDTAARHEILRTWWQAILGVTPALVLGLLFGDFIEEKLFNPLTVTISLFVGGVVLLIVDRGDRPGVKHRLADLGYPTVIAIGLFQCLAMIPGTSRAAATIIGAMLLGASRGVATEFSFFLAIPTMVAASGYSLIKHGASTSGPEFVALAIGFVVSFIVALAVIAILMRYIRTHTFALFAWYRIALALIIAALMATGSFATGL